MPERIQENNCTEQPSKRYFQGTTLDEVISSYPVTRKGLSAREVEKGAFNQVFVSSTYAPNPHWSPEMANRVAFTDFLKGLLRLNPLERWSPQQARMHPFITGEKHTGPFTPNPSKRAAQEAPEAGAPRGLRPRANTISSSQIDRQNVPPQLQKLVALSSTTSGPERQRGSKGEAEPVSEKEKEEYTQQQKALARGKSADSHRRLKHEHPPAVIVGEDVSMDSPGGAAPPPERDEALAQAEDFMRSADAGDDDMDMDTDAVEEGVSQGLQKIMDGLTFKNNGGGSGVADDMDADVAKDGPVLCDGVLDHRTFGDAVRICETSDQDDDDFFVADKEPCDDEMDMPIALSDARYTPLLPEACDLGVLLENNCGSLSHGASLLPRAGRDRPPSRASPLG